MHASAVSQRLYSIQRTNQVVRWAEKLEHVLTYGWPYTHVVVFNKDFPVLFIDTQNSLPISSFLFCYCQTWMLFSHLFSYLVYCTAFVCTAIIISYNTFIMFCANESDVLDSLERCEFMQIFILMPYFAFAAINSKRWSFRFDVSFCIEHFYQSIDWILCW